MFDCCVYCIYSYICIRFAGRIGVFGYCLFGLPPSLPIFSNTWYVYIKFILLFFSGCCFSCFLSFLQSVFLCFIFSSRSIVFSLFRRTCELLRCVCILCLWYPAQLIRHGIALVCVLYSISMCLGYPTLSCLSVS